MRAAPLPFQQLRHLPGDDGPWTTGGPVFPRNLVVLGAWFMLREIEAAAARASHVDLVTSEVLGEARVHWSLPASKTDQAALGVNRSHGCLCVDKADPLCPAHAAWDHHRRLLLRFGVKGEHGNLELPEGFPFFPNAQGRTCSKEEMAATFVAAARHLGVPAASPDGSERITGHTLRVTGAQGMARAGLDVWAIQLLGRWGSSAVMNYVRDAQLDTATAWATKANRTSSASSSASALSLEKLVEDLIDKKLNKVTAPQPPIMDKAPVGTDLSNALAHEVAAAARPPADAALDVVRSSTEIWHAVLFGPPTADLDTAVTHCGWKFGRSGASLKQRSELPKVHKSLCARCFPTLREELKAAASSAARKLG